jgi:hypothetical protein
VTCPKRSVEVADVFGGQQEHVLLPREEIKYPEGTGTKGMNRLKPADALLAKEGQCNKVRGEPGTQSFNDESAFCKIDAIKKTLNATP